jgi:uncharacterized membrane protein YoaK (UPF0700 family)
MPLNYVRRLTSPVRSAHANLHLGLTLAFVGGAANAGGFMAVHQYTSHMTGIVSALAGHLALGALDLAFDGAGALLSFLAGAACSAVMVNFARRRSLHSTFALPLLLEACLLLVFGVVGSGLQGVRGLFVPATVMLLCFMMGLQNAVITKLSHAEIRTTHITGIVTDIGIELGKLVYWNGPGHFPGGRVVADRMRLRTLALLAASFLGGGVAGTLGFLHLGFYATIPLAILLVLLTIVPAADDLFGAARRAPQNQDRSLRR